MSVKYNSLFLASLLALGSCGAFAQKIDKATGCLEMAAHAKKFFRGLQQLVAKDPNGRDFYVEEVKRLNFDQYKKNVASTGGGSATAWNIQYSWGEIGIREYLRTPDVSPDVAEMNINNMCMMSGSQ